MALKPLEVLKKGLKILQNRVKDKKEKLQAQLAEKVSILSQDENWLDHRATSSRFWTLGRELQTTRGVWRVVDDAEKGVVRKLWEVTGDLSKLVGNKRKHTCMYYVCDSRIHQ
jgi:hypothetical protein